MKSRTPLLGGMACLAVIASLAACQPTVDPDPVVSVESISLDVTSLSLRVGDTASLVATVGPADATDSSVSWASSDEAVAAVDSNGQVTAKAAGSATVSVKTTDGGKTATCAVTVSAASASGSVTGVVLSYTRVTMAPGGTASLVATVYPTGATNKSVTWATSDANVATVSAVGLITAAAVGSATITVSTADGGKQATCVVTVDAAAVSVTSVAFDDADAITLDAGASTSLGYTVSPSNATNRSVTFTSSDPSVATVDSYGRVRGLTAGTVSITVWTVDGGYSDVIELTIRSVVERVSIDATELALVKGDQHRLSATVSPADAYNATIRWTTTDPSVATVDSASGMVTAVSSGSVTIRAKVVEDPLYRYPYADCLVTVTVPVQGVSLDRDEASLTTGETLQLSASLDPVGASSTGLSWSSSDGTVATVSDAGLVTAVGAGDATITVTTDDGGKTAGCTVHVVSSGIAINFSGFGDETIDLTASEESYLYKYGGSNSSLTIQVNGSYETYAWYIDGSTGSNESSMYYFYASDYAVGVHTITVVVTVSDGTPYSKSVKARVEYSK